MCFHELKLKTQQAYQKSVAVIGWTIAGAALGAVGGGVFGVLFAILWALSHGDASRIVWMQAYFAFCGAVAGALTGAFGRSFDAIGTPASGSCVFRAPPRGDSQDRIPACILPEAIARRMTTIQIGRESLAPPDWP